MEKALKNIGIMAHVDAGKTTVTELLLYLSGRISKPGKVDNGTTGSDTMAVEKRRGISVKSSNLWFEWRNTHVNIFDTPGHVDFVSEVERAINAIDGAVLLISAPEGINAHTMTIWEALKSMNLPVIIFINKIDRAGSSIDELIDDIKERLSRDAYSISQISNEGSDNADSRIIDNHTELEDLTEFLSDYDDDIMKDYLDSNDIDEKRLWNSFSMLSKQGRIYPVMIGSAKFNIGIDDLLDGILSYLPSPNGDTNKALSARVTGISHHNALGRICHVRVYDGMISLRQNIPNANRNVEEKVTRLLRFHGDKHEAIYYIKAGEIGAVAGMPSAQIGDHLGSGDDLSDIYTMPEPAMEIKVIPETDMLQETRLALKELSDEDPYLNYKWISSLRECRIRIFGKIQLEILCEILRTRYELNPIMEKPTVICRETPTKCAVGHASYTMPKPCWARVTFEIEPGEPGSGVQYKSIVNTHKLLPVYQNHIEKCLDMTLKQGLYAWEVTDIKITLTDGEYHKFHTHPLDFFVATPMAIMDALRNSDMTILEPMYSYVIRGEATYLSRIIGDLTAMRAIYQSPVIKGDLFEISGRVSVSEAMDYSERLASRTGGKGSISLHIDGYSPCPMEFAHEGIRIGANPLDRPKWILSARGALKNQSFFG